MRQKTYSSERPEKLYRIENIQNSYCTVVFIDNITTLTDEEGNTYYEYDSYVHDGVLYRKNLDALIGTEFNIWLNEAKQYDYDKAAAEIRKQRDALLNDTDWTQLPDSALSQEKQERYRIYRQALRDVPEQEGFPYDVIFPTF